MSTSRTPGTWARVRLHLECPGDGRRPHQPAEENCRVEVTSIDNDGDHGAFALYKGGGKSNAPPRRRPRHRPLLPP